MTIFEPLTKFDCFLAGALFVVVYLGMVRYYRRHG